MYLYIWSLKWIPVLLESDVLSRFAQLGLKSSCENDVSDGN